MNIFHYESKPMQILMYVGDLIILNVIYILCSLSITLIVALIGWLCKISITNPIFIAALILSLFPVGAAQAGLYSAVKVMQDKEEDSSPVKAFFKGFANGFGTVTIAWGILTLLLIIVAVASAYTSVLNGIVTGINLPLWVFIIPVILVALFQSLVPIFHSRFSCKPLHLIRNCWFLLVGHPLRSIGVAILTWLPAVIFLRYDFIFGAILPAWITLYFSTAATFSLKFMKKPFDTLIEYFSEQDAEAEELPAAGETEEVPAE